MYVVVPFALTHKAPLLILSYCNKGDTILNSLAPCGLKDPCPPLIFRLKAVLPLTTSLTPILPIPPEFPRREIRGNHTYFPTRRTAIIPYNLFVKSALGHHKATMVVWQILIPRSKKRDLSYEEETNDWGDKTVLFQR